MSTYRISQLAERTGVPATTLRFYETVGLLSAERSVSGYRLYGQDAVERLRFVGAAKDLGLSLEEIAELLAVWESGACSEVRADLRPRLVTRITDAERRTAELQEFTASLRGALDHLDALPDRAGGCDAECGFLDSARTPPVSKEPSPRADRSDEQRWRTAPVACSLTSDAIGGRVEQWQQLIRGAEHEEIPDGRRLTLPVQHAEAVATLAAAEQRCCPFFDFRLHLDGSVLHLEVRAPVEGAGLLAELFTPAA
ncbi:MerR family transcriptional regulator [Actinomadura sp. DC4]|uniref:MerR family transcriptional regulator n=1 Tax=Actinomadura sp. DC4 TaxID=3055069 RepID=UPI0025AEF5B3|nr:MerR family transcriptional regulator [Actinomadura sp. DC4]MDN3359785.1 MerR family transcriptional regulator [Actinomadura sp. DC4]